MDNAEIARTLAEVADLLEIQQANPFRVRAYRNAVRTVEAQTTPLERMLAQGEALTELPGFGKEMASHVRELVESGRMTVLEELAAKVPRSLVDLMQLPGVGPKKAAKLWSELGVQSVDELEEAAEAGKVAELAGFGAKSQRKILGGIADYRQHSQRFRLSEADRFVRPLVEHLEAVPEVERLTVAGSYRRRCETVGDLDLLVTASQAAPVMSAFTGYGPVERVERAGETRATVILRSGLQVDLRVVEPECYGAALVYFTGSKEHNVRLRQRGVERGLKISEYGVFRVGEEEAAEENRAPEPDAAEPAGRPDPKGGERIAGATEEEVYAAVELPWVPPELREDRGEIAAAAKGELPRLVTRDDLRGDLHMHSTWSDGRASIDEMVTACAERGYAYLAISDHSKALAMTNGLDAARLKEQWEEIAEVQERHPEIRILRSQEVDILADGRLDLEDEALEQLDLVLVSVHSRFELPQAEQTERVLKAIEHPQVNVLCHPTGRLINRRKPIELDLDEVLHAAAQHGVAMEINANPMRLDLKDTHLMLAKKLGVKVVISTDAHRPTHLGFITYGIEQARRAWLEPGDVLNCLGLEALEEWLG